MQGIGKLTCIETKQFKTDKLLKEHHEKEKDETAYSHYIGDFDNSMKHGKGVYTFLNFHYEGDFQYNNAHGEGVFKFGGNEITGTYKMGKLHGTAHRKFEDGRAYKEEWDNGVQLKTPEWLKEQTKLNMEMNKGKPGVNPK